MKYLGIDFGSKRIGLSVSDDGGSIAFPGETIPLGPQTISRITDMITSEGIETVVIGDTRAADGSKNAVTKELEAFVADLTLLVMIPIELEREFFTTQFAAQFYDYKKPVATPHRTGKKTEKSDASAAALILQRYLDKKQNGNK